MKFRFILVMLLCFAEIYAGKIQHIKNIDQIFDGIGHSKKDIVAFAKTTMEEDNSLCNQDGDTTQNKAQLIFDLQLRPRSSKNNNENIEHYLNTTTDEKLRTQIIKSHIDEGKNLLNDLFNTTLYKALQKELKKLVSAMTSCSFLSAEESKKLSSLKIFYPDDYKSSSYEWEPVFEDNNISALRGSLHKVIGLKGNKNHNSRDCFLMMLDVVYECFLGKTEENTFNVYEFNSKNDRNKIASPTIKLYIEPRHSMHVNITFLRQKNIDTFCSVSFFCYAHGEENIEFFDKLENENYRATIDIHVDTSKASTPPLISGQCTLINGFNSPIYHDLVTQCSDFLIETKK